MAIRTIGIDARARWRAAIFVPLIAAALGFAAFAFQTPQFRYPLDYGEGMILDQAWLLAQGENIYRPAPASPPYLVPSYPPLLPALEAPLVKAFGPAYWYGRLIAQLSALAAALAIGLIVARLTRIRSAGFVAGATLLAVPAVSITSQMNRVDTLALALALIAVACATGRLTRARLVAAGALIVAAGFTRQTAWLPAGAAIVAHLAAERRMRAAAALGAGVLGAAAVIAGALQIATGGFWFAVAGSNVTRLSFEHATLVVGPALVPIGGFIAALVVAIVTGWRRREAWAPLLTGYTAGSLPALVAAGNVGSSANYVFPFAAATAIGVGFAWSLIETDRRRAVRQFGALALAAQAVWCAWLDRPFRLVPAQYLTRLEQIVRATPGPVLADATLGLLPLAGKHVWIEPFKMSELARAGTWDEQPFIQDLQHHRFSLILLRSDASGRLEPAPWTGPAWRAVQANYQACGEVVIDAARRVSLLRPAPDCADGAQ